MKYRISCSVFAIIMVTIIGCSPAGRYLPALKNSDPEIRRGAAIELNTLYSFNKRAIREIIIAAEDSDPVVRVYALKVIGKLPPRTEGVSGVIRSALRDSNLTVRRTAVATFSSMNPVPAEILIPLANTLADKDSVLYSYIISTFMDLGPIGVHALMNSCKSENQDLRYRAAATLGLIGRDATRALPMLKKMLDDQSDSVRTIAKTSIDRIQVASVRTNRPVVR